MIFNMEYGWIINSGVFDYISLYMRLFFFYKYVFNICIIIMLNGKYVFIKYVGIVRFIYDIVFENILYV